MGREPLPEVGGQARLDRVQVDHRVALDDPEPQRPVFLEPDDFHGRRHPFCTRYL